MSVNKCGARTRAGTPCQLRAGFGTDHVGEGACKYHCGCTPRHTERGRLHPEYKHGLYAEGLSDDETVEFGEFVQRFDLMKVSQDELRGLYRAMKALLAPGPIGPLDITKALSQIASWKKVHHEMAAGTKVQVSFDQPEIEQVISRFREIILKFVPAEKHQELIDELRTLETADSL